MFVLPLARTTTYSRNVRSPSFDRFVDRLFDESLDRLAGTAPAAATRTPAMDVSESDSHFTISFDVPGATRDALKVSVEGRRVALTTVAPVVEATDKTAEPAVETKPAERALYRERA